MRCLHWTLGPNASTNKDETKETRPHMTKRHLNAGNTRQGAITPAHLRTVYRSIIFWTVQHLRRLDNDLRKQRLVDRLHDQHISAATSLPSATQTRCAEPTAHVQHLSLEHVLLGSVREGHSYPGDGRFETRRDQFDSYLRSCAFFERLPCGNSFRADRDKLVAGRD